MCPLDLQPVSKKYFTIGEVAILLHVSTSLIRFWEKEFAILQPQKDTSGIRQYTQRDIQQIKYIYSLVKDQGYSLRGAKKVISAQYKKKQARDTTEIVTQLKNIKEFLHKIKAQM